MDGEHVASFLRCDKQSDNFSSEKPSADNLSLLQAYFFFQQKTQLLFQIRLYSISLQTNAFPTRAVSFFKKFPKNSLRSNHNFSV